MRTISNLIVFIEIPSHAYCCFALQAYSVLGSTRELIEISQLIKGEWRDVNDFFHSSIITTLRFFNYILSLLVVMILIYRKLMC